MGYFSDLTETTKSAPILPKYPESPVSKIEKPTERFISLTSTRPHDPTREGMFSDLVKDFEKEKKKSIFSDEPTLSEKMLKFTFDRGINVLDILAISRKAFHKYFLQPNVIELTRATGMREEQIKELENLKWDQGYIKYVLVPNLKKIISGLEGKTAKRGMFEDIIEKKPTGGGMFAHLLEKPGYDISRKGMTYISPPLPEGERVPLIDHLSSIVNFLEVAGGDPAIIAGSQLSIGFKGALRKGGVALSKNRVLSSKGVKALGKYMKVPANAKFKGHLYNPFVQNKVVGDLINKYGPDVLEEGGIKFFGQTIIPRATMKAAVTEPLPIVKRSIQELTEPTRKFFGGLFIKDYALRKKYPAFAEAVEELGRKTGLNIDEYYARLQKIVGGLPRKERVKLTGILEESYRKGKTSPDLAKLTALERKYTILNKEIEKMNSRVTKLLPEEELSFGGPNLSVSERIRAHILNPYELSLPERLLSSEAKVVKQAGLRGYQLDTDAMKSLSKHGRVAFRKIQAIRDKITKGYLDRGLLAEEKLTEHYVKHVRTKDLPGLYYSLKSIKQQTKPGSLRARQIAGTIDAINKRFGKEFFTTDISQIMAASGKESIEAFNAHDFIQRVALNKEWSKDATRIMTKTAKGVNVSKYIADPGWETLPGLPLMHGKQVPKEIAEAVKRVAGFGEYSTTEKFLRNYWDPITDLWKVWVIAPWPRYHTRNAFSNVWMNWVDGVSDPLNYEIARQIQTGAAGTVSGRFGKEYTFKQLRALGKVLGVEGRGWYGADIPDILRTAKARNFWSLSRESAIIQTGMKVGTTIENNARYANFIDKIRKGWSPGEAAKATKAALYDYTQVSQFERKVMKRLMPFYTWTRKNIPRQIENLALAPEKMQMTMLAARGLESKEVPPEEVYLADWIKENYPIRIKGKDGQTYYFLLGGWLPAADLNQIFRPLGTISGMGHPVLKEVIQQSIGPAGYDFYFKRPIESYPGEREKYLAIMMRKRASHTIASLPVVGRAAGELQRLDPFGLMKGRPVKEEKKQKVSAAAKFAHFFLGRTYPSDPKAKVFTALELKSEISEIKKGLRKAAIKSKTRPVYRSERDRLRRLLKEKTEEWRKKRLSESLLREE